MSYDFPEYPKDWSSIKRRIKKRDSYICCDCERKFSKYSKHLQVHHKAPLSKGGSNKDSNLKTVCIKCHSEYHDHLKKFVNSKKYRKSYKSKVISKKSNYRNNFKHKKSYKRSKL